MAPLGKTDVVVIGGGPAGLAAAIALRQRGLACVVVEPLRPPIDKGCGEGLMPDALLALGELGVKIAESEGYRFRGIRFANRSHSVDACFPVGTGLGVRRPVLHAALSHRAKSLGAQLLWGSRARLGEQGLVQIDGVEVRYDWLVGADGQASTVRTWAGLQAQSQFQQRFGLRRHYRVKPWSDFVEVYWGPGGQAYVTPVAADCVCVAVITREHREDREGLGLRFPGLAARLAGAEMVTQQRGAISATRRLKRVSGGKVALVGDASGSADSITGEGLAMAFRQSLALAETIACGDLQRYEKAHRAINRLPQRMAQMMLHLDRFPALEQRGLRALAATPRLFDRLLRVHTGEESLERFAARRGLHLAWKVLAGRGA